MTGGGARAAGGPARHVPVLLNEVLSALAPRSGEFFIDATFGAGGYTKALLAAGANVLAIDRDPAAIAAGQPLVQAGGGRLRLVQGRFGRLDEIAAETGVGKIDGVVLDIGVSSMQLDEGARGFSFAKDGPLDMRMESAGPTAADVVNRADVKDLTRILGLYGEERFAARVARAIVARREREPFRLTLDLAATIAGALPSGGRIHPATRAFQGLRIYVNGELDELADALLAAERLLGEGGRLAVVSFHSLEDRIVKRFLAERSQAPAVSRHLPDVASAAPTFALARRGAVEPGEAEIAANARARSARLRFAVRTGAAARSGDRSFHKPAALPPLSAFGQAARRDAANA
jgi:16S rRNA (cytosine1402-N4)-methyltransferase